jgi:hypothetical protein
VDTNKVSFGEMIAGASGLALFIFMFLPWYGASASTNLPGGEDFSVSGGSVSAWGAFSFIDILLFLVAVVAIGLVLMQMADSSLDLPQPPGLIIAAAGALAVVLILFRLIFTPGEDTSGLGVELEVTRKIGIFLGLIAAAGITYGGWTAMNERASGQAPGSAAPPPAV